MNCPAFISLLASKCGQYLQVMQVCNQHNHIISKDAIKQIPQHRKLMPDVKEEVFHLLSAKIQRDEIIKYVKLRTGVQLTAKTIHNFTMELKKTKKKCISNAIVLERIQQFLAMHKTTLAVDTSHQNVEPFVEIDEIVKSEASSTDILGRCIGISMEENYYQPMREIDSTIEFSNNNCDGVINDDDNDDRFTIERIESSELQEHLGMYKMPVADQQHERLIEIETDVIVKPESSTDLFEPYFDSSIQEPDEPMEEYDSFIEFINENCETVNNNGHTQIIESIEPSEALQQKTSESNRCQNCAMAKCTKSLKCEIKILRQMKRQLIREMINLKRKKIQIIQSHESIEMNQELKLK